MKTNHLTLVAAVAIAGIGSFIAGRVSAPDSPNATNAGQASGLPTKSARSDAGPGATAAPARDRSRGDRRDSPGQPAADDPTERMRDALALVNPVDRTRAWLDFLDRLSNDDFLGVITAFREKGVPEDRMGEYAMLLSAWAKTDPLAALDYATANTGSPFARQTILAAWAAYDPDAALRWAEANHDGEGANPWIVGVIRGIASTDPARATALMAAMPYSGERGEALAALLPTILGQGPDAARNWVSGLADARLRDGAMMQVAERLAAVDPKGTADWLLANPGDAASRRMDDVLSAWMNSDKEAAVAYFRNLPAGDARSNALRGIVNSMALENPRQAASFLDNHTSDVNDGVVQQFVWHAFREEPSIAADYIGRIVNQDEREQMYRRTLDFWLQRDAPAAQSWIAGNPLPESVVQYLEGRAQERQQRQQ